MASMELSRAALAAAYRAEMEASYSALSGWDGEATLLSRGNRFVKSHAVASSAHEFTVAITLLAALAPLTIGAAINLFSDSWTPLNIMTVQVGYPQTRKSQMTKLVKEIGDVLDEFIASKAANIVQGAFEDPGFCDFDMFYTSCFLRAV